MKKFLAIDFGASSGRGIVGEINDGKVKLEEIHRFSNDPVLTDAGFYWDSLRLFFEIKNSILKAELAGGIDSIGIDTWGVDYAYIDSLGAPISPSFHYRDSRTDDSMKEAYEIVSYEEVYKVSGIESMNFNTMFQLFDDQKRRPWLQDAARNVLFTPDFFNYLLTGKVASEYTIASTSSLMDANSREFSKDLCLKLSIKDELFAPVVMPGNILGNVVPAILGETGNTRAVVVNVASHDTSSAIVAVPSLVDDFLFISSGTWSLMGTESNVPIINDVSRKYSFTNEGGAFGKYNVMKNIMGLWLIQESRRQWKREGIELSFDEMTEAAMSSTPFASIINPDDHSFNMSGDLPGKIREYCKKTNQPIPETVGAIVRCIFESLALRYRWTAEKLEELTGKKYEFINIVGGGTKDPMLCNFTANGTKRTVVAGPVEATSIGNIMVQALALGEISDIKEARTIVRNSFETKVYEPDLSMLEGWDKAYEKFVSLVD